MGVADIQMTVGDESFDCLQKLYGIHQNVLAGFAGTVLGGFALVARLQRLIDETPASQGAVNLDLLFSAYPAAAQDVFARLPAESAQAGTAVLVAAAEPAPNTLYGSRGRCARFRSPGF